MGIDSIERNTCNYYRRMRDDVSELFRSNLKIRHIRLVLLDPKYLIGENEPDV